MSQSEKNLYALQDYMNQKEAKGNGNTWLFKDSVTHYKKKPCNKYSIIDTVHANYDCDIVLTELKQLRPRNDA